MVAQLIYRVQMKSISREDRWYWGGTVILLMLIAGVVYSLVART